MRAESPSRLYLAVAMSDERWRWCSWNGVFNTCLGHWPTILGDSMMILIVILTDFRRTLGEVPKNADSHFPLSKTKQNCFRGASVATFEFWCVSKRIRPLTASDHYWWLTLRVVESFSHSQPIRKTDSWFEQGSSALSNRPRTNRKIKRDLATYYDTHFSKHRETTKVLLLFN